MTERERFSVKLVFPPLYKGKPVFIPDTAVPPLGMAVLSGYLRSKGYETEQDDLIGMLSPSIPVRDEILGVDSGNVDFLRAQKFLYEGGEDKELEEAGRAAAEKINVEKFTLIGFSVHSRFHFISALIIARAIRKISSVPIVMGGTFFNYCRELVRDTFRYADYIVTGRGEGPMSGLIAFLRQEISSLDDVPGLHIAGKEKTGELAAAGFSGEENVCPDFNGLDLNKYGIKGLFGRKLWVPYQTSEGCGGACSFCVHNMTGPLRFKDNERCLSELRFLKERLGVKNFVFVDSTINADPDRLSSFCERIISSGLKIFWTGTARASELPFGLLRKMKISGCRRLSFGIESGSKNILTSANKKLSLSEAEEIIKNSARAGIKTTVCLIAGYPHEKQEDIDASKRFLERNRRYIHQVNVRIFQLLHSSRIYFDPRGFGVDNLTRTHAFSYAYGFDEIGGLPWEQKRIQQEDSLRQINETLERLGYRN